MSDIFICYARVDREVANRLAGVLRAQGWSVFLDTHTSVGQPFDMRIDEELRSARAVVVLWSPASIASEDVRAEASYARSKNKLFPAVIEPVEIPVRFTLRQSADMIGWAGEPGHPGLAQLRASLRAELGDLTPETRKPLDASEIASHLSAEHLTPGQTFRDKLSVGGEGPLMVVVPAGRFLMGSTTDEPERADDEGPQHEVRIGRPFGIGVYTITFDEYDAAARLLGARRPDDNGWGRGQRPVVNVSWHEAQMYRAWLSGVTGRGYRLPTEAEWEYACRAGTATPFHFGTRIDSGLANYDSQNSYNGSPKGTFRKRTEPVGRFPPNAFGVYDMHGNVWEWCQDAWHSDYSGAPSDGMPWDGADASPCVLRGGSWLSVPENCRAANRFQCNRWVCDDTVGFRVCCSLSVD